MAGPVHAYDSELGLYAPTMPFNDGFLERGIHHIYFEEIGNPVGIPVLFLHGGPGAGCAPAHRRLFDPQRYRVILMDQRGCGRSEPFASIQQNTTQDLIADVEKKATVNEKTIQLFKLEIEELKLKAKNPLAN